MDPLVTQLLEALGKSIDPAKLQASLGASFTPPAQQPITSRDGPRDEVLKLLPPLTIELGLLEEGLALVEQAAKDVAARLDRDGSLREEAAE